MKIFGIIIEASPFHNGHQYFINKIRETYAPDVVIAVCSTSFTMRGDISTIDKFNKTSALLNNGVDMVVELPFFHAVQSADYFAEASVSILNALKITDLVFGCETTDFDFLERAIRVIASIKVNQKMKKNISLKENINSYLADYDFSDDDIKSFNGPNFTLALQYIYSIKKNHFPINYHFIKRDTTDKLSIQYPSATALRNLLIENQSIAKYLPENVSVINHYSKYQENLFLLIKSAYQIHSDENNIYFSSHEGLDNYISKNGDFSNNYQTFLDSLKNKKYTVSRMKRNILHRLLKTPLGAPIHTTYIRLLGINQVGRSYLYLLPKETKQLIFSNPNEAKGFDKAIQDTLDLELKATKLYSIICEQPDLFKKEYTLPIRKE